MTKQEAMEWFGLKSSDVISEERTRELIETAKRRMNNARLPISILKKEAKDLEALEALLD